MHTSRRLRAVTGAIAAAAVLGTVAACGSAGNASGPLAGASPAEAAQSGLSSLLDHDALTATVTLDASPATLDAVFGADSDAPIDAADARKLAGATVVVAAETGGGPLRSLVGSGATPKDASFALTVSTLATANLVQVVVTSQALYARADVDQLLVLLGSSAAPLTGLLHAPNLPGPLAAAVAGRWVVISPSDVGAMAGSAVPSVGPNRAAALAESLAKIFRDDVTVTAAAPDPSLGDHFVLSGNLRTIGSDLQAAVRGVFGQVPGLQGSASNALPDRTITIDEYVRNGTASAFRVDLTQLLNAAETKAAAGRPAMLDIDLKSTATITAPEHAQPLDLASLAPLLGGLLAGGLPPATPPS